jgi:hypothetical protein
MPKIVHKLTDARVRAAPEGRHADGHGLYLNIAGGSRSWLFRFRDGRQRRAIGLGAYPAVSLADARKAAAACATARAAGGDPVDARPAAKVERADGTFGAFAESFLASNAVAAFKNSKHRQQWASTLRTYAAPIWAKPIASVTPDDVFQILEPIWIEVPETASRLRGRLERVFSAAKVAGLRDQGSLNPAAWKDNLAARLASPKKRKRGHHAALLYAKAPEFMTRLRTRHSVSARALEFTILCAARTTEVRLMAWPEVDLEAGVWTVPEDRMKSEREHVVPLPAQALALLRSMRQGRGFASGRFCRRATRAQ